uniref:Uncharacterized protein n=1 Tax=Rhizophora mucronata TaxID=61149 RepID=A0A2P2N9M1_RHIMU
MTRKIYASRPCFQLVSSHLEIITGR